MRGISTPAEDLSASQEGRLSLEWAGKQQPTLCDLSHWQHFKATLLKRTKSILFPLLLSRFILHYFLQTLCYITHKLTLLRITKHSAFFKNCLLLFVSELCAIVTHCDHFACRRISVHDKLLKMKFILNLNIIVLTIIPLMYCSIFPWNKMYVDFLCLIYYLKPEYLINKVITFHYKKQWKIQILFYVICVCVCVCVCVCLCLRLLLKSFFVADCAEQRTNTEQTWYEFTRLQQKALRFNICT
jgi:hypothetical protein